MSALAVFRTRILLMLGDSSSARYSNDEVDEALRQALVLYSKAYPQISSQEITISAAGRDQTLTTCTNFMNLIDFIYPYDSTAADPLVYAYPFYVFWKAGTPYLHIGGSAVPAAAEKILANFSAFHEVEDLDSAAATTVREDHESFLVIGAAGTAAINRGAKVFEAYGSQSNDNDELVAWGNQRMAAFQNILDDLSRSDSPRPSSGFPGSSPHWDLDKWDRVDNWDAD